MGAVDDLLKKKTGGGKGPAPTVRTPQPRSGSAVDDLLSAKTGKTTATKGGADNSAGGILGQAVHAVGGVAKGLGSLIAELGESQMQLQYKKGAAPESERLPLLTEVLVRSPTKTAKSFATPVQALKGTPWAETELGKRITEEGVVGTALSTAADLSIFAGGVGALGKAAGAGRIAQAGRLDELAGASAKAAGLSRKATLAQIEEAAKIAKAAGNTGRAAGLSHAAGQARLAETLRTMRPASVGEKLTAGAKSASSFGAHIAAAPAKPYGLVGRHLLKPVGGKLSGTAVGTAVKGFVSEQRTKKQFRDLYHNEVAAPLSQYAYDLVEGQHKWGESMKNLDLDHQAAVTLRHAQAGADPAFRQFWDGLDDVGRQELIGKAYPEVDAVNALNIMRQWDEGALDPKTTGRLDTAAERMRNFYDQRQSEVFVPGRGENLSERGLEARRQQAEGVPSDLAVGLRAEKLQAGTKRRLARTEAEAAQLRATPAEAAPKTRAQERRLAADAEHVRRATQEAAREGRRVERTTVAGERAMAGVEAAGNRRIGDVIGRGRERLAHAYEGQLERGISGRAKQAELKARRLEVQAAKSPRLASTQKPGPAAGASAATEARAAADLAASANRGTAPGAVRRSISQQAGAAERVTAAEARATRRVIGAEGRRQQVAASGAQGRLARAHAEAAERSKRIDAGNVARGERAQTRRLDTLSTRRDRDLAKIEALHKKAETDIRTAPAQDIPALRLNQAAAEMARNFAKADPTQATRYLGLAEEMATTTQALRAKGIEPRFSFGGKDVESRSPVVGSGGPAIRGNRKITRQRQEGRLRLSLASQAERATKEMGDILINELPAKVQKAMGTTVSALDGPAIRGTGAEMSKALEARNLYAWDPKTGKRLAPEDVTTASAVVPRPIFDSYDSYVQKPNEKSLAFKAGKVFDQTTGTWKVTVLALSPSWHVGNLKGNAIMLTMGGGPDAVLQLPEALRQVRKGEAPIEILASGFRANLDDMATGVGGGAVRRTGRAVIKKSFAMNSFIDNVGRTAVYLTERKKGVSHEAGVKAALRAMGDFSRMTRNERRIVRRLAPFWAWQKHITTLSFRLPLENPARVAWTLHLAESADRSIDDPGKDNEFNAGTLPGPNGSRIPLFGVDPFSSSIPVSVMTEGLKSLPRALGYSLNPIIKTGIAGVGGIDPNKGLKAVSTPETGDTFGEPYPLLPVTPARARRLAEYAAQSVPQVRKLQDAIQGEAQARLSTGQPTRSTERGRLAQLFRLLGVPFPEPEQKSKKKRN